jgi:hypothetical protein
MLMMERNNAEIAALIDAWLRRQDFPATDAPTKDAIHG